MGRSAEDSESFNVVKRCACGAIIPAERLELLPGTTQCVNCAKSNPPAGKKIEILGSSDGGRNGFASKS